MMSSCEGRRRVVDANIHTRRRNITRIDEHLKAFREAGVASDNYVRLMFLRARSELSAMQGYDKAAARKDDKSRIRSTPVTMTRGVAVRVA
jgi:hypothetical protein